MLNLYYNFCKSDAIRCKDLKTLTDGKPLCPYEDCVRNAVMIYGEQIGLEYMKTLKVNGREYEIVKLLGKGKGGYSYLAKKDDKEYVLKQIHHEPCSYYQFGDKIQSELNDYDRLRKIGIRMPAMIDVDVENERILKEYIEGDTIYDLVLNDKMQDEYLDQVKEMCALLYPANTNIDYFPTNFVVCDGKIFYIDYECNDYMEEWNFENWGIKYWSKTEEFMKYVEEHK